MTEEHPNLDPWTPWTVDVPPNYREPLIGLCLTTPGEVEKHVWRDEDGKYWVMEWKPHERTRRWAPITDATAQALCQPVADYWGKAHWLELFGEPEPAADDGGNLDAKLLDTLTGDQQKLLRYLWTKGSASIDKLRRTVWQGKTVSDQAVKQAGYRLGEAIYKHGMAVRVSKNGLLLDKGRQE